MAVQDIKVFLCAVMGCRDLDWMKVPPEHVKRLATIRDMSPISPETDNIDEVFSSHEYGINLYEKERQKKRKPRERLGYFVDLNDGQGPRFLLTEEEINWVNS